jgi:hypothetical protein
VLRYRSAFYHENAAYYLVGGFCSSLARLEVQLELWSQKKTFERRCRLCGLTSDYFPLSVTRIRDLDGAVLTMATDFVGFLGGCKLLEREIAANFSEAMRAPRLGGKGPFASPTFPSKRFACLSNSSTMLNTITRDGFLGGCVPLPGCNALFEGS